MLVYGARHFSHGKLVTVVHDIVSVPTARAILLVSCLQEIPNSKFTELVFTPHIDPQTCIWYVRTHACTRTHADFTFIYLPEVYGLLQLLCNFPCFIFSWSILPLQSSWSLSLWPIENLWARNISLWILVMGLLCESDNNNQH